MKVIKPSCQILYPESPYKHIEKIGRICYKSENAITDVSAEPFINNLVTNKHYAMIEHFRFIVEIIEMDYSILRAIDHNKYMTFTDCNGRYIVSMSARSLNDIYTDNLDTMQKYVIETITAAIILRYDCESLFKHELSKASILMLMAGDIRYTRIIDNFDELSDEEYNMHAWYSVHFVCDRGVTHEMVRHRDASFAQESTRYCNYSKGKYDNEITVIAPLFWSPVTDEYNVWWRYCALAEKAYMGLIDRGATPQEARSVLPNSLKTEIVVTAQVYEWKHIFNLRVLGTTGKPHPQMKEVMSPVYTAMLNNQMLR